MVTYAKEYENFIISGFREESLNTLVPGGQNERYLNLCRRINNLEKENKEKLREDLYKYLNESENGTINDRLKLNYLFTKYDLEDTNQQEKDAIIDSIKKDFIFDSFEYNKPSNYGQNKAQLNDEDKFSSKLDENIFNYEEVLENIYKSDLRYIDENLNNELSSYNLPWYIDFTKFSDELLMEILNRESFFTPKSCLNKMYLYVNQKGLLEKLARLASRPDLAKFYNAENFFNSVHLSMTTDQLEHFMSLLPKSFNKDNLINELINRKFTCYLQKASDNLNKRKILLQIYSYLKNKPLTFNSMKCDILLLLLENGVIVNIYDKALFMEYLEDPIYIQTRECKLLPDKVEKINKWSNNRQIICNTSNKTSSEEKSIVSKYLQYFFIYEKSTVEEFASYFNNDFLLKEFYTAMVLRGEENESIIKFLTNNVYENLVKKNEIKICDYNKDRFSVDELIKISVDIKNVSTLFVKIFEINTENYYYNKKVALNSAISLEGLIATYEETYSFFEKPQKLINRVFEFDKVPYKRGIFIIEFIGSGYSSRALVKKGGLSLVHRNTVNGKILFILDENQKICKGESTGVWVRDQFYKSESDSGAIIIPYQRIPTNENVVLVHENFAEIASINLESENYRLDGTFIINKESILMGNLAKVLIRPYLFINNRMIDVNNLINPKIKVNLVKFENDQEIPITTTFDGEYLKNKITDANEIEIEFQIPPRLKLINLTFQAEIKNKSQEVNNTLSFSKSISVNENTNYNNKYAKMFLRKIDENYIIDVLGNNGEPKADVQITINFKHKLKKVKKNIILQTNEDGQIHLGKLPGVYRIIAFGRYRDEPIEDFFSIRSENVISYPNQMDIIEGEQISFPIDNENDIMETFYFNKTLDNKVLENLTSQVKINSHNENEKSGQHKFISIGDLTEGVYILGWNYNNRKVLINVHKGQYWENENFILTKTEIIENNEYKNPVHLQDFNYIEKEGEAKKIIHLKVNKNAINPRVHLFAYKFLSVFESFNSLALMGNLAQGRYNNKYSFQKWKNVYLSNRKLNEEIQYVFDRKQYESSMGNSLDKPSLLTKRQFIRDTTTIIQDAKEGTQYAKKEMEMLNDIPQQYQRKDNDLYGIGIEKHQKMAHRNSSYNYGDDERESAESACDFNMMFSNAAEITNQISTFHNFLAHSPIIVENLIPDENGEINLEIDLTNYSVVHALVIDSKSVYEENLYLNNSDISKRDLTMSNPLNPLKSYSELRKTETLLTGNKFTIGDITSTNFQIIDSLDKLITYYSLTDNYNSLKLTWNKLNFLIKFGDLSSSEKIKKLSEFFSHEVNIYLFFKHNDFFSENVKPVLKYKAEKTFIDFFLLEDKEKIKEFCIPSRYNEMNTFEQCLLIYSIRKAEPELAGVIAKNIRNEGRINKISEGELKRMFNIIMNMKTEEKVKELVAKSYLEDSALNNFCQIQCEAAGGFGATGAASNVNYMAASLHQEAKPKMMLRMHKMTAQPSDPFQNLNVSEEEIVNKNIRNNLFKESGKSKEYCETHYYNNKSSFKFLTQNNEFYADLADFWVKNPDAHLAHNFISSNIILPVNSLTQLISILAVIDLPQRSMSHKMDRLEGRGLQIIPVSNMIVFTKEISETTSDIKSALMIAQIVNKKNANEENERETNIDNVYIVNEIYKHETIVTNISNKTMNFELLIQIPQGAIPVDKSDYTKTNNLSVSKFMTSKFETFFYFPNCGDFIQFPPSASVNGIVISKTASMSYKVNDKIVKLTHTSLDDVLESGSKKEILEFLKKSDYLKQSDINKVYWLLKDGEFYKNLISILRERGIYDHNVWKFSLIHKDAFTVKEFFGNHKEIKNVIGPIADYYLLKIDETMNYDLLNHKDYHPILNARVHRINQEKNSSILNVEFKQTYEEFICYLIGLKKIDSKNYLRLCYYLILQDRIEDALKIYEQIDNSNLTMTLQYDYVSAYLDFSVGYPDFKTARSICAKYKDFSLKHWRELFEEIEDQLLEFDGTESFDNIDVMMDEEKKKKQTTKLANQEPKLSFAIDNKNLQILYTNINSVTIRFYLIDLEILFSRTPFIKQNSDDFSFVQPNFIRTVKLDLSTKENIFTYSIPEEYLNSNLFIEVSSLSKKSFDTYFSTSLLVNISETLGEVKVIDSKLNTLTKTYVKCFAKYKDESVKFYKDGYTDLRGKFNYVSLNTNALKDIKRFSLFISNDVFGSTIKECNPPSNLESFSKGDDMTNMNEYDVYQNYRQEVKNVWRSQKMKK